MSTYKHSQKFLEKKLQKVKKELVRLQKEKIKLTEQYLKTFPKEMIELVREQKENE